MGFLQPQSEWLRCSALASLTGDGKWLARQAGLAAAIHSPDAIMTLLNLAWLHGLSRGGSRDGLLQLMRDIDAPRLQGLLAARLPAGTAAKVRPPGRPLRVAVYTPQVQGKLHGGTSFALNVMNVLTQSGIAFRAFSAQEASIPGSIGYVGGSEVLAGFDVNQESLKLDVPGSVELVLPDTQFSLRRRFELMLEAIDEYAPDLVIFVGFMSPVVYRLYERYPVVGLSVHSIAPTVPVDVWLASEDAVAAGNYWPTLPVPRVAPFPYRFWPRGKASPLPRESAGLPVDGTLLVSAGFRLHAEIGGAWCGRMLALLDANPNLHWLLIGVADGVVREALPRHPRILLAKPHTKLERWLASCDIYVNPPRVGGGASVAIAMEQGVPVVTHAGTDGGDKLSGMSHTGDEAYFAQLESWIGEPGKRRAAGQEQRRHFLANHDISSELAAAGLRQALESALESFAQRSNGVAAVECC